VFVNRVWGHLMGSYLVATPSDFGLQSKPPTHPGLLDWLAADFMEHGWSVKHLVRTIVMSETYQQSSTHRDEIAELDPTNQWLWRANRKHLSIEAIRDSLLAVSNQLDRTPKGRAAPLWGEQYTRRRAIYGYINRFNLDPTLRAFDFPTPMQTQPGRDESIVAPQALFTLNSPFVIDRAQDLIQLPTFVEAESDETRVAALFRAVFQREPAPPETSRIVKLIQAQSRLEMTRKHTTRFVSTWPTVAQALLMTNEFQYVD